MDLSGIVGISLVVANCIISFLGLRNQTIIESYCFEVDKILIKKEWIRIISSGFFHVNWIHLLFNMFSLYVFSQLLEKEVGHLLFLFIYIVSLVGGNLLALFIHRHHGDYRAVGASGAVSGIIFSSIALFPGMKIDMFFIYGIPSWIFGAIYILITLYGIRSKKTNIGHEAHLGGALAGMLLAIGFYPHVLSENYLPILVVTIPSILFIVLIAWKPDFLLASGLPKRKLQSYNIDDMYNEQKVNKEKEIDRILEKIHQKGINSLSSREKKTLESYSSKK